MTAEALTPAAGGGEWQQAVTYAVRDLDRRVRWLERIVWAALGAATASGGLLGALITQ